METGGFYFLDKDKRGDFKICEDLQFVTAMNHPGGGRNDVPNRLKRHFFAFNLVLPSLASIDDLYGQMLRGRFPTGEFKPGAVDVAQRLTGATVRGGKGDRWGGALIALGTPLTSLPTPLPFPSRSTCGASSSAR